MTKRLRNGILLGAALLAAHPGFASNQETTSGMSRVEREVRRELITLPYYSLFDHLAFRVDGETVTLMGRVTRPTLKSGAEIAAPVDPGPPGPPAAVSAPATRAVAPVLNRADPPRRPGEPDGLAVPETACRTAAVIYPGPGAGLRRRGAASASSGSG
jgi:hypothetical protein